MSRTVLLPRREMVAAWSADWKLQAGFSRGEGASGSSEPVAPTASGLGPGFVHREVMTLQGCVSAAGTEIHSRVTCLQGVDVKV